ncbi:MAG: hypothetical protein Tsb009_08860 [Planctomycetaceae bacterium]
MAFVAPMFFLLVFAMVEFSRMVMVQQSLTNAAREAGRIAALKTTTASSDAETAARTFLQSSISNASDPNIVSISISPSNLSNMATGTAITTTVSVKYSDISWMPPAFLSNAVLRGKATIIRE